MLRLSLVSPNTVNFPNRCPCILAVLFFCLSFANSIVLQPQDLVSPCTTLSNDVSKTLLQYGHIKLQIQCLLSFFFLIRSTI